MKWLSKLRRGGRSASTAAAPPAPDPAEALTAARELADCQARAQALLRVLPHLPPAERGPVQREVLAAVAECAQNAARWAPAEIVVPLEAQPAYEYTTAWTVVVNSLSPELLDTLLATVEILPNDQERGWALAALRAVFGSAAVTRAHRNFLSTWRWLWCNATSLSLRVAGWLVCGSTVVSCKLRDILTRITKASCKSWSINSK